jgi:hypothetical protein
MKKCISQYQNKYASVTITVAVVDDEIVVMFNDHTMPLDVFVDYATKAIVSGYIADTYASAPLDQKQSIADATLQRIESTGEIYAERSKLTKNVALYTALAAIRGWDAVKLEKYLQQPPKALIAGLKSLQASHPELYSQVCDKAGYAAPKVDIDNLIGGDL